MSGSNGVVEYYPMPIETEDREWVELVWPETKPGYSINRSGDVLSPGGNKLKPGFRGNGETFWVTIPYDEENKKKRGQGNGCSARVDKLVLTTFVRPAGPGELPLHLNDDMSDNRLENLRWATVDEFPQHRRKGAQNSLTAEGVPKGARKRKKAAAAPVKKVAAKAPRTPSGGIEVLRVYRDGKLQISVDQDGHAKLPKLSYTAAELAKLTALCERAVEMNNLMKL